MPAIPSFPSVDLSSLQLPRFELPRVDVPKLTLPRVELPDVDLPRIDTSRLTALARDAAYVGVGLGVLAVQQAQVRRREVRATVESGLRRLGDAVAAAR